MPPTATIAKTLLRIPLTLALAGLLGIALVRLAPGFGVEERELDARYDGAAVAAMRSEGAGSFRDAVVRQVERFFTGDWGMSKAFGIPVRQLLGERWQETLASVSGGLVLAWVAALLLGVSGILWRGVDWGGSAVSFGLLSIPAGLIAIAVFLAGAPVAFGIAATVFPQVFRYIRQLMRDAMEQPCIYSAAARGVGRLTIVVRHAGALVRPQLLSLLGASAATAAGAAIPMEALCDAPGLGQLAWKAAMSRDLDLLVPLLLTLTLTIQLANACAELFAAASHGAQEGATV